MKNGDYVICSFNGGDNPGHDTFPAEVAFVDEMAEVLTIHLLDSGLQLTINYRDDPAQPWNASGSDGNQYSLIRHDIFEAENASPSAGDVALITFADSSRALCYVEDTTSGTLIQLFHSPYPRLTLGIDTLSSSEMPEHPVGEIILSLQRCTLNNAIPAERPIFSNGWCSLAERRDAYPGRIGGAISPFAIVLHTTDMVPESFNGLIHRWQTEEGEKNGAHFVIGRDASQGVVQLVSIERNANHAGGPGHGWFEFGGQRWLPNNVSVGIEIHCGGMVKQEAGKWYIYGEEKTAAYEIPDAEVIPYAKHPGYGFHRVTEWQYQQLEAILDGVVATLADLPNGCVAISVGQTPDQWARFADGRVVGHASLHFKDKSDPGPQVCEWARKWRAAH